MALLAAGIASSAAAGTPRPRWEPAAEALVDARVVVAPGKVVERATVLLRDGIIEAVGPDVAMPADARVWERSGDTVYAGFIEAYLEVVERKEQGERQESENGEEGALLVRATRSLAGERPDAGVADAYRRAGFTTALLAPAKGILRGRSAAVNLGDGDAAAELLVPEIFQHAAFERSSKAGVYPRSLMGTVALLRQSFLDAAWQARAQAAYTANPAQRRPSWDPDLAALASAAAGEEPVLFVTADAHSSLRAVSLAEELGLSAVLLGNGEEHRFLPRLAAAGLPVILPLAFPPPPEPGEDGREPDVEALRAWDRAPDNPRLLAEAGLPVAFTAHGLSAPREVFGQIARAVERGLPRERALAALTTVPAALLGIADRAGTVEPGRMANLVVVAGDPWQAEPPLREVWIDGQRYPVREDLAAAGEREPATEDNVRRDEVTPDEASAADPAPAPEPPTRLLVRGATVWTAGPRGTLEGADLLVEEGRVAAVGVGLAAPDGAEVIEAAGKHVTPGLVDAHSHVALEGGTNESGRAVSAAVRVEDVLRSDDPNLYRQLAGGVTAALVLHGSANPVGGQSAAIKLRWGEPPRGLLLDGGPPGLKLALGENPKGRRRGGDRFPRTRMGVELLLRESFLEARAYRERRRAWEEAGRPETRVAPRRHLALEALAEVLDGTRLVHAHAYRADEILVLLGLAEELGFRVASLEHALEAYRVADEIAAHGAAVSTFADHWGYKPEAWNALPENAALLHRRGVLVSLHSDDAERGRRLNLEAAKSVRSGGLSDEEALRLVTLNPARQLGLEERIGSLEPGKDADFAVWSGHPLSSFSVCEQTWVDGVKRFDRAEDPRRREADEAERQALLAGAREVRGAAAAIALDLDPPAMGAGPAPPIPPGPPEAPP